MLFRWQTLRQRVGLNITHKSNDECLESIGDINRNDIPMEWQSCSYFDSNSDPRYVTQYRLIYIQSIVRKENQENIVCIISDIYFIREMSDQTMRRKCQIYVANRLMIVREWH